MSALGYVFGEICKVLLPIPEEVYFGKQNSTIAICTLSSIDLLKEISTSDLLDHVAIVGRLFSENKGIDSIIKYVNSNKNINTIILCGKEVWGHKAGHSLLQLYKNGINDDCRIINSTSPAPILESNRNEITTFQNQVTIIDKIGETNPTVITELVSSLQA